MKYFLVIPLIFFCSITFSQVPLKQSVNEGLRGDITIDEPIGPRSKNAGYYQKDGKYGFVYPEDVRQEPVYSYINFSNDGGFIVKKDGLYGIADKKGVIVGKIEFDSLASINNKDYIVKKNGKYGTLSTTGVKILSIKYDKILATNNLVSFVQTNSGKTQMVFNDQEQLFPGEIQSAVLYTNLIIIKANGKFGVVKNKLIVPLEYDSIFVSPVQRNTVNPRAVKTPKAAPLIDRSNSLNNVTVLTLQNNNKYGLADNNGQVIYTTDNDAVYNQEMFRYYTVKKGSLYGIYFIDGNNKTGIDFDYVYADGLGYVMANKNKKGGVFDLKGKQLVPFEYDPDFIMQYHMGFGVKKNKKKGIVSKDGTVLIPPIYDNVDPFYETGLEGFVKVQLNGKFGIVNLKGQVIIPAEYDWVGEEKGLIKVVTANRQFGLYDKTGKVVIPPEYKWIVDSDTENSNLLIIQKADNSYNFLNKNTRQLLLKENVVGYGYINDRDGLLNPFSSAGKLLLYVKNKTGKLGLLNEVTGLLDVPMVYDDIIQRFEGSKHTYYSVKKGKKYGLIDEANRPVLPLQYDAISIDMLRADESRLSEPSYSVVVAKGNKFGTVNLTNKTVIPFQYSGLQRISSNGLYKAKVGSYYQIINAKNQIINKGPFDEVANFEATSGYDRSGPDKYQALTFYKGKMRVVDGNGKFTTAEVAMLPHSGYKTFNELKWALIKALDSNDDLLLKDFASNIAPSEHILFYLKENPFGGQPLQYTDVKAIREKYYNDLLTFKRRYWNQTSGRAYNRASLTEITDYTLFYRDVGFVTNSRRTDNAFGNRFMEKLLRDAFKINGYWISSYFMQRNFESYEP